MVADNLVVIVGETASGKSALAMYLAQKYGGEIICADSRTVYKGMDIGTAKPSLADRETIRHFGLDLVEPNERFTAADFKQYAERAIVDISSRGKLPILVGGTGLYIDAILYDYSFREPADMKLRDELGDLTVEQLQDEVLKAGITMPENDRNPRHLIRALETGGQQGQASPLRPSTLLLGLAPDRDTLRERIERRVDTMIADGFVEEARVLGQIYGWDAPALQAPGYKAIKEFIEGGLSLDEAKALFVRNDLGLAKRQRTWFRRNKSIHWLPEGDERLKSAEFITTLLNT